jgi:hypothetical protein
MIKFLIGVLRNLKSGIQKPLKKTGPYRKAIGVGD